MKWIAFFSPWILGSGVFIPSLDLHDQLIQPLEEMLLKFPAASVCLRSQALLPPAAVWRLDDMFLPLTALLIGLSQQEGVWLSAGGPGWQFGPQLQFGPPAEARMSREENLL